MKHAHLLSTLLPPTSYQPNSPKLAAQLAAEGAQLDLVVVSSEQVLKGLTPSGDLLPEWEELVGIYPATDAPLQTRIQAVLAKLAAIGGLSLPYFIRLARSMGYQIQIQELDTIRAGSSRAGDQLWALQSLFMAGQGMAGQALAVPYLQWCWRVIVNGDAKHMIQFRSGQSVAGERLTVFGDAVLEAVIRELTPAHTFVDFIYTS